MPDDDLTPVQRSVLLILMAEAREIPNAYLTNDRKLKLDKNLRDGLEKRGLIEVRKEKSGHVHLELAERGWRWCRDQSWEEVPPSPSHGGSAAYTILAGLRRYLAGNPARTVPDLFARLDAPLDLEARIRKAYLELAPGPGRWVSLADLRPKLPDIPRADLDRALIGLNRAPDVSIVPESNQKLLDERSRSAGVRIGTQDKHLIAIGL